jgi:hypothetical protein
LFHYCVIYINHIVSKVITIYDQPYGFKAQPYVQGQPWTHPPLFYEPPHCVSTSSIRRCGSMRNIQPGKRPDNDRKIFIKGIKSVQWSLFFLCMWSLLSRGRSILSTSLCPNRPLHERSTQHRYSSISDIQRLAEDQSRFYSFLLALGWRWSLIIAA